MSVETELKLRIAPEHMARLKRHPLLKSLALGRAVTRELHNIYYDTPGLDLQQHAMALRLRRAGGKWLQTLKGGGGVEAGLHSRNEWETPVAGEALDFDALLAAGGRLPPGVGKKLEPVFRTDFTRSLYHLNYQGADVELCMDSGEIIAGPKNHAKALSRPISELELELKSGEPQQLFELALALLDIVPLEVEHASKAEYGYRLYSGVKLEAVRAQLPELEKNQPIAVALRSLIAACLLHVQANVPGALQKSDEEYLHQVRVGLRRLRVALAMAETYKPDAALAALHRQVADLCAELGRTREWDVFVTETLMPMRAKLPDHAGLQDLVRASERMRKQHHARMQASLASQDFQRLMLRVGYWMQGSYWHESPVESGASLAAFAAHLLEKRSRQVKRRGRQMTQGDAAESEKLMHALRISCKKLRYSAEMFGPLFGTGKTSRYLAGLTRLQDIMGILNDIGIAYRLLDELHTEKRRETQALVHGWLQHGRAEQMAELKTAWKRFAGQGAFWQ